ncbi:MAG: hypothetical protein WDO18_06025 [Acidobacteriota bacterium]
MKVMRAIWLFSAIVVCAHAQAPPAPAKPKPAARPVPPARVVEFKAEPSTIQPGQSTMLIWAVENPTSTIISGLGSVVARGSRRVTPTATTPYTLTVSGPNGESSTVVVVTVAGTTPVAAATSPSTSAKPMPRLADGKPDLTGVYNSSSFQFAGRAVRGQNDPFTGKLKPGAESYKIVRGPTDAGQHAKCSPTGLPGAYFVPYQWQIVHQKDYIVIMYEYPHLFRVIPIASANNPADHPVDPDPTWMGNSVAKWDGDTLVVDVIGFNEKTELPGGFRHSEDLHVVERFRRVDYDNLEYTATIEDPKVFVEPWTISRGFPLRPDLQTVSEFICENNKDYGALFEENKNDKK